MCPFPSMIRQRARAGGVETLVSLRVAPRKEAKASTPDRAGFRFGNLLAGHCFLSLALTTMLCLPGVVEEASSEPFYSETYLFNGTERYPSCHGSTIVELPNGDLFAAWYAGSREKGRDVAILSSRKVDGATGWSDFSVLADDPERSEGNPVLFRDPDDLLWLFFQTMYGSGEGRTRQGTGWTTCKVKSITSGDNGVTWSDERVLIEEHGYLTRNRAVVLADGDYLLPMQDERNWSSRMFLTSDKGRTWFMSDRIDCGLGFKKGNIEPSVLVRKDGSLLSYMRTGSEDHWVWKSVSPDNGRTWTEPVEINIPNSNVALDLLRLRNGNIAFAFNNTKDGRTPLTLALSSDDCETWEVFRDLETDPGEYSYPTLIQDSDGNIHVTYTYRRERIKHVVVNEDWIRQGERRLLRVTEGDS